MPRRKNCVSPRRSSGETKTRSGDRTNASESGSTPRTPTACFLRLVYRATTLTTGSVKNKNKTRRVPFAPSSRCTRVRDPRATRPPRPRRGRARLSPRRSRRTFPARSRAAGRWSARSAVTAREQRAPPRNRFPTCTRISTKAAPARWSCSSARGGTPRGACRRSRARRPSATARTSRTTTSTSSWRASTSSPQACSPRSARAASRARSLTKTKRRRSRRGRRHWSPGVRKNYGREKRHTQTRSRHGAYLPSSPPLKGLRLGRGVNTARRFASRRATRWARRSAAGRSRRRRRRATDSTPTATVYGRRPCPAHRACLRCRGTSACA
mmetsp:Transcript_1653/g.6856  ORF Transcript_1653/g.6856 Transcript_1653/m.6856 type:complete len:326 (+) Transcript_1653:556-1533(+)